MHTSNIHEFPSGSRSGLRSRAGDTFQIAEAYDHVGDAYGRYADGDEAEDSANATVRSAHADSIVWGTICNLIDKLRASGVTTLRLLDAGCGPGTWVRRITAHAAALGLKVEATGFDISNAQLAIAREQAAILGASIPCSLRPRLEFIEHNLARPLPWEDGAFHIVLCNFVVLNHLSRAALPGVVAELCRVSAYRVVATVRALASPPTACITDLDDTLELHQDCAAGELAVVLKDGTWHRFTFNLYSAEAMKAAFVPFAEVVDIRAVDLFVNRFNADPNWTAEVIRTLPGRSDVLTKLKEIEESLCRQPGLVDHGTHVLIVAEPRH